MRFREKLLILFVAVILSFLGFYLISSSFAELHTLARERDTDQSESYLAECDVNKSLLNSYLSKSSFSCATGASE
ncbi:MAG: hypothetical protein JSV17_04025 [Candidatus Aminicenantes bacterium]|nr:MAG: hypothetical protein JSV17_04025 [Candidatus Aminicenantes bacterium]